MSKAEKTRQFIIETSASVFNMKGYAGTSLSDIMQVTGLTKGSIYGNFENKDEVAVEVYRYNIAVLKKLLKQAMSTKESAEDKLFAFTGYYRENWKKIFEKGGCPILNAAVEVDDTLTFMKGHVQQSIVDWTNQIGRLIQFGQEKGEFRPELDAREYAYTILTFLEGGMMLSKIMNNQQLLYSALDRIEMLVKNELKPIQ